MAYVYRMEKKWNYFGNYSRGNMYILFFVASWNSLFVCLVFGGGVGSDCSVA